MITAVEYTLFNLAPSPFPISNVMNRDTAEFRAPEMMVRIQEVTETGFIGTVENMSGFTVFADGTQITVTIDLETDPDFDPDAYNPEDLILVMYTSWDENEKTIVASIIGIVEEPIID